MDDIHETGQLIAARAAGRRKNMDMMQDGVEVFCLPDSAKCCADEEERSPLDIDECPMGYAECTGDCYHYAE